MDGTRREFLDAVATGAVAGVALAALPRPLAAAPMLRHQPAPAELGFDGADGVQQASWDTNWPSRLGGRVKAVFDVGEVQSGVPVWRASIWAAQYQQVLQMAASDVSTALVMRANGVVLAFTTAFWEKYGIGPAFEVRHPVTGAPATGNPALFGEADGVPANLANFALDRFQARGGVALACDLALRSLVVPRVAAVERDASGAAVTPARAYEIARAGLVPGVVLQPSGLFAVFRAQEVGAHYIRAD